MNENQSLREMRFFNHRQALSPAMAEKKQGAQAFRRELGSPTTKPAIS
jgi:hypothetical protein